ncbi:MAG: hypothetical protein JXR51_12630 [Bacteroidales bacterium]|nr:hypothetical protein [Bacteroidales bacterium]
MSYLVNLEKEFNKDISKLNKFNKNHIKIINELTNTYIIKRDSFVKSVDNIYKEIIVWLKNYLEGYTIYNIEYNIIIVYNNNINIYYFKDKDIDIYNILKELNINIKDYNINKYKIKEEDIIRKGVIYYSENIYKHIKGKE